MVASSRLAAISMNTPLQPSLKATRSGSTLIEALLSAAIASTAIAGLCVANASCLGIARAHKEVLVADQCLQLRIEQCRAATWTQLTDGNNVSNILAQPSGNDGSLQGQIETISISPYPDVTPTVAPLVVNRDATGARSLLSQPPVGFSLRSAVAVRIDVQESWTSAQARRTRQRAASTVVALGGLLH